MEVDIRPIRAHEWREVRELRLRALRDEAAAIAFLDDHDDAAARPDAFWQARAEAASLDAGDAARARQFVAIAPDGTWVGSVSVLLEREGEADFEGAPIREAGGAVVGVYVDPSHRGAGVIDGLLDAAVDWVRARGLRRIRLTVHADNLRAQAAYRRAGFRPTGVEPHTSIGPEVELAREV